MTPYIQTEVSESTKARLEAYAKRRKTSLKQIARELLEDVPEPWDPTSDPIWGLVGTGTLPKGNWSEQKHWRQPPEP